MGSCPFPWFCFPPLAETSGGPQMAATHSVAEEIFDSRVKAHFEKNVELYVDKALECYEEASLLRLAQLAQVAGFRPSAKVRLLDVGCGGGFFLDLFLDEFTNASACGVDFSPAMLQANTPSRRKDLFQGDALHLPAECSDFEVINIDT